MSWVFQRALFYTKVQYGRQFSDIESRKEAFLAAKSAVDKHNAEADQGLHTYWKEVNEFAIMVFMQTISSWRRVVVNAVDHLLNEFFIQMNY